CYTRSSYKSDLVMIDNNMAKARRNLFPALALLAALLLAATLQAQSTPQVWVGSWAASQQTPEPQNALPPSDMTDATIRQIVHLSVGGTTLRVHLSNAFGQAPLHFTSVHIARPLSAASPQIDPVSDRALAFSGSSEVTIPAHAQPRITFTAITSQQRISPAQKRWTIGSSFPALT